MGFLEWNRKHPSSGQQMIVRRKPQNATTIANKDARRNLEDFLGRMAEAYRLDVRGIKLYTKEKYGCFSIEGFWPGDDVPGSSVHNAKTSTEIYRKLLQKAREEFILKTYYERAVPKYCHTFPNRTEVEFLWRRHPSKKTVKINVQGFDTGINQDFEDSTRYGTRESAVDELYFRAYGRHLPSKWREEQPSVDRA